MSRPRKQNAEYFSHDADMRDDDKMKVIRAKFGVEGYAVFCMLLEVLTDADGFKIDVDSLTLDLLAGDFGIPVERLQEIIDCFRYLKLISVENDRLYSPGLIKRMQPLIATRATKRRWAQENLPNSTSKNTITAVNSTSKTPQSKGKGKVKVSKDTGKASRQKNDINAFDVPPTLADPEFVKELQVLINEPKWVRKSHTAVQRCIDKLGRYDVRFSTDLVQKAIRSGWQDVTYDDTDAKYQQWQRSGQAMPGTASPAPTKNGRANINGLGQRHVPDEEKQFF